MSLKNPVTPPGIEPGTIRLVAQLVLFTIFCHIDKKSNNFLGLLFDGMVQSF